MTESRKLRQSVLQIARNILGCPTAPFHEDLVARAIREELEGVARITTDRYGNMIARVGRASDRDGLAFCAHMDHPGFVLKKVSGKNIESVFLGWVHPPYFKRGVVVEIFDARGKRTGKARVVRPMNWKKEKRVQLKLVGGTARAGQFGMWAFAGMRLQGRKLHSRACDDLIGCTAIVATLQELARRKKPGIGIFTRREEIGLCGAFDLARSKRLPKKMKIISVETSSERCNALQKDGPIVRVGDRSAIFDPTLTSILCSRAYELKVKSRGKFLWQRKLMDGGTCEATAFLKQGYPSSGLCIALGNYHNCGPHERIQPENVDVDDLVGLVQLMTEVSASR